MGMYDYIEVEDSIELPGNPKDVAFQTKTFDTRDFTIYKITNEGQILQEEYHLEKIPKEDRPYPNADGDDFESFIGSMKKVKDGWIELDYTGSIKFYDRIGRETEMTEDDNGLNINVIEEGTWYEYNAYFESGDLQEIERIKD